jgi:hypothetical protein
VLRVETYWLLDSGKIRTPKGSLVLPDDCERQHINHDGGQYQRVSKYIVLKFLICSQEGQNYAKLKFRSIFLGFEFDSWVL